jgi:type II secretory pathway pseudopilin PulG
MMQAQKYQGFTLLETLIYIGLFTIIIGGALVSSYYIFESSSELQTKVYGEQEGEFVLTKINYLLNSTATATISGTPEVLTITRGGNTYLLTYDATTQQVKLKKDTGAYQILNGTNAPITNFQMQKLQTSGQPDKLVISFSIRSLNFSTTKYLRP